MSRAKARARQNEIRNYAFAAFLFAVVLAAIGGWIYWKNTTKTTSYDPLTMCPTTGARGHIVLLIDTTDPFTFTQKETFVSLIREIVERRTPEGYLLSIFMLGEDYKENAKPVVELCNPGTGLDKSVWTDDVKGLRRAYEEQFVAPMTKQAEGLSSTASAKASPIFEMVQLAGINAFERHAIPGERRLVVVSDMLHNTPEFSMYTDQPDYTRFASSDYGKKAQAALEGVKVELHYLMNTPRLQNRANSVFWELYFDKAGARLVTVKPLAG